MSFNLEEEYRHVVGLNIVLNILVGSGIRKYMRKK
jgi:hypothetical protein